MAAKKIHNPMLNGGAPRPAGDDDGGANPLGLDERVTDPGSTPAQKADGLVDQAKKARELKLSLLTEEERAEVEEQEQRDAARAARGRASAIEGKRGAQAGRPRGAARAGFAAFVIANRTR